jgi:hypothetical protein
VKVAFCFCIFLFLAYLFHHEAKGEDDRCFFYTRCIRVSDVMRLTSNRTAAAPCSFCVFLVLRCLSLEEGEEGMYDVYVWNVGLRE